MREMKTEQTSARRRRLVFFSRSLPRWLPERRLLNAFGTCPNALSNDRDATAPTSPRAKPARGTHPSRSGCPRMRWRAGSPAGRAAWGGASSDRAVALPRHRSCRRPNIRAAARSTPGRSPGVGARPALGASLRLASTAAGTPVFAGATCERVDVELRTARTRVTVGFETGRVARSRTAPWPPRWATPSRCARRRPRASPIRTRVSSPCPWTTASAPRRTARSRRRSRAERGRPKIARCSRCASSTARSGLCSRRASGTRPACRWWCWRPTRARTRRCSR